MDVSLNECHLILCHPLFLLPPIPPSIGIFPNESTPCMRCPKYWISALASFLPKKIQRWFPSGWFDLLANQGTLKSLLQHHSSKASILWHSAFFIVQFSNPYMTTGKTIALTRWIFVGKVMSLLFKMLSRFVIAFLPRSKHLLISWLKSPSAVILEPLKIKSATVSTVFPSICHEVMGPNLVNISKYNPHKQSLPNSRTINISPKGCINLSKMKFRVIH